MRHLPDWFPGAGFKRTAKELAPQYLNMIETPFNFVKKQLVSGLITVVPTFRIDGWSGGWDGRRVFHGQMVKAEHL